MEEDSSAFSSVFGLFILFSLFIIVISVSLFVGTSIKKTDRVAENYRKYNEANIVVKNVLNDIQALKNCEKDFLLCEELEVIKNRYAKYNLDIFDISTGANERFLSEKIKGDLKIEEICEITGVDIISSYGWINEKYADESLLNDLYEEYGLEDLFPLVCQFPLNNVNFMNKEYIESVLSYFEIPDRKNKVNKILSKQFSGITEDELLEILKCKKESKVLDFLGTKTSFWKVIMTVEGFSVVTIIAAVPDRENQRNVREYILVEKKVKKV